MTEFESVMVVERASIPPLWLPEFGAVPLDIWKCPSCRCSFMERETAERDVRYKQIIPYMILHSPQNRLFCYKRKGNESRLHGLYSVGIGGHVNPVDKGRNFWLTVLNGLKREVCEETGLNLSKFNFRGIINEEMTSVGRVHIGLVFTATVNENQIKESCLSNELYQYDWRPFNENFYNIKLEHWSRLAVRLLK